MEKNRFWIWENENYPNFKYSIEEINPLLFNIIKKQAMLESSIKYLSTQEQRYLFVETLADEIIYSAYIEGDILKRDSVRSSIRKQFENLEVEFDDKHTDNIVSIQKDLNENHNPLTVERLHSWHQFIFSESSYDLTQVKLGCFREYDDMLVVSGERTRRKVHYQAPPAKDLNKHIEKFLDYVNNSENHPFIKSAIAHIWFVQIHPYGDGNGRMTRNITNHILSKSLGLNSSYFSISHSISRDRGKYATILEETNRYNKNPNMDLTNWIKWHTSKIADAISLSLEVIEKSIKKTKFYDKIRDIKINEKQAVVINTLLVGREKIVTNNLYRVLTKTNPTTASRQLSDLVKKGILKPFENQKGRSTAYELNIEEDFRDELEQKMKIDQKVKRF
jgi:Fic family protein